MDDTKVITSADIIHGNTDAFSVPANGEYRVTLNLSQYNVGTDYRLYATVRGSTWVNLGAIYCNDNQAIIDLRNLNSTAVKVTLWYTVRAVAALSYGRFRHPTTNKHVFPCSSRWRNNPAPYVAYACFYTIVYFTRYLRIYDIFNQCDCTH